MSTITVPYRPFATEPYTGMMVPDGIFVNLLGAQRINAHCTNIGAADAEGSVYIESVSHPGVVVTPQTHALGTLSSQSARLVSWDADFSACPAGKHFISFIIEDAAGNKTRIIKHMFVLGLTLNPNNGVFSATTPEGVLAVRLSDFARPGDCCCEDETDQQKPTKHPERCKSPEVTSFSEMTREVRRQKILCRPGYLPGRIQSGWTPTPPYSGQYSDLPYQDPWWKVLLCVIAFLLLVAAAIEEAINGTGSITASAGTGSTGGGSPGSCCGVSASGSGTSPVAAGLVAAAAAVATVAAASDVRDPQRRGEDHTAPAEGELTVAELVDMRFSYPEPVALGKPFVANLSWKYRRTTTGANYDHSDNDAFANIHVTSSYEIKAEEVYRRYRDEAWIIEGRFFRADGEQFSGNDLMVQCYLIGPNEQLIRLVMQDDGNWPDEKGNDGTYTAAWRFSDQKGTHSSEGLWRYFVIAQDVNHATPDLTPEEAAQIIGGMVITQQLTITFDEDECPFVPDGHVLVV